MTTSDSFPWLPKRHERNFLEAARRFCATIFAWTQGEGVLTIRRVRSRPIAVGQGGGRSLELYGLAKKVAARGKAPEEW